MLTSVQVGAIAFVLAAIWLGVGGLMVMRWQVRSTLDHSFKLRMNPKETQEVIQRHREMFPRSIVRKVVGYGSLAAGVVAAIAALLSSRTQ